MTHKIRPLLLALFIMPLLSNSAHAAGWWLDYLNPTTLTGTIYADEGLKQKLFTFRRTATSDGSTVHVVREFNLPNGKVAAREHVEYEGGQLKSFTLEELQTGAKGSVTVEAGKMNFDYTEGATHKTGSEKFLNEILVSDMVGPYIAANWNALAAGETVKCRLVSVSRAESVGFKFFKESDGTWNGQPVEIITLQASSFVIAKFVEPLHFVVEKTGAHRVLQYSGRTTPSILKNGKWQDLDAVTVFDWK